jgi:hypothetical protein
MFIVCLFFSSLFAHEILFLGAGGEPVKKNNIVIEETAFDFDLELIDQVNKKWNWRARVLHDGHHSRSFEKARAAFPKSKKLTTPAIKDELASLLQRMKDHDGKNPLPLLIVISTHGFPITYKQKTHSIATADYPIEFGQLAAEFNLDELQLLTEYAKENPHKKIHIGILDLSCHSGETLKLANAQTCVISATGAQIPSYSGAGHFSSEILKALSSSRNLEEAYLKAFSQFKGLETPLISTERGKYVQLRLEQLIAPYLLVSEKADAKDFLFHYFADINTGGKLCHYQTPYEKLADFVHGVGGLALMNGLTEEWRKLEKTLQTYAEFRKEMQAKMLKLEIHRPYERFGPFCENIQVTKKSLKDRNCLSYTREQLLTIQFSDLLVTERMKILKNQPADLAKIHIWEQAQKVALKLIEEEKARAPKSQVTLSDVWASYTQLREKTIDLASQVGQAAKEFSLKLYGDHSTDPQDPCVKFKLPHP